MDLVAVLSEAKTEVLDEAAEGLARSHLGHYDASGPEEQRLHLEALFDVVVDCLHRRELVHVAGYAEEIARDRFISGFGIGEVQTAFNVLEESMWRQVTTKVPAEELSESLGLLTTVLGVGKDALARTYVSLASHQHVQSLDLRAMFRGTGG
ncbi:MAG: hypothetical protein ABSD78_16770 [Acidimicrobiales bacterium]|jgi:hypothetical protein